MVGNDASLEMHLGDIDFFKYNVRVPEDYTLRARSSIEATFVTKGKMEKDLMDSPSTALGPSVIALRLIGLWPSHSHSSIVLKTLYAIYNKFVLATMCIFASAIAIDLVQNCGDLTIVTDSGCFLSVTLSIIFKIFNCQLRLERIRNLMDAVHEPLKTLRCSSDRAVVTLIKTAVFYEKYVLYFFVVANSFYVPSIMLSVPPEEGTLPIRTKYPFIDITTHPMYTIGFIIEAYGMAIGAIAVIAIDSIALGFCRFIHLQIQVLAANYEHCQSTSSSRGRIELPKGAATKKFFIFDEDTKIRCFVPFNSNEVSVTEDDFVKRFQTCIRHHQRLIKIIDETNELFSSSVLAHMSSSLMTICLTVFQVVLGSDESKDVIKFILLFGIAFGHMFYWCWIGNNIIYECDSLATGQWFSGWEEEENLSTATTMIIMSLIRTRRPMALTAGGFYTLSMETFLGILRGSYSFFAVLSTANDGD